MSYVRNKKCCGCGIRADTIPKNLIIRVSELMLDRVIKFFNNQNIQKGDFICNKCRTKINRQSNSVAINTLNNFDEPSQDSNESFQIYQDDLKSNLNSCIEDEEEYDEVSSPPVFPSNKFPLGRFAYLRMAYSSHHYCLICTRIKKSLHQVKAASIARAYLEYEIVIKQGSRCCRRHLDELGLIKTDDFHFIKTSFELFDKQTVFMLNCLRDSHNNCGIFDKFKNMATLDEEQCYKITRWSKIQFITFSKYITSLNDTAGRTKEQLIAIYRYWLFKGLDQSSLAVYKNSTSQQQISHYLDQIRLAMRSDFVPFFLGANRSREFYLHHNNTTAKELHSMGKTTLGVVADGTYTHLEKSSNNQFQYLSYSGQKKDNLIKPFIICCLDGYIIDCYGPFQATYNDATILDYILDTDENLVRILKPKKTIIFLDRGKLFALLKLIFPTI